jgi:hypothetical protein
VFDFKQLEPHLDEDATVIYVAGHGNVFSHLSSLAVIEPLIAIDGHKDYRTALTNVWNEVMEVAGLCEAPQLPTATFLASRSIVRARAYCSLTFRNTT